jgi:hypothetical protein
LHVGQTQGTSLALCQPRLLLTNLYLKTKIIFQLNKQLERCMAAINSGLLKHNLILGVDDRGKLSCHKVNLCFMYFEPQECIV